MKETNIVPISGNVHYFAPEEIIIDETINARPFSSQMGDTEEETKAIDELKESIKVHGQQVPVKVRTNGTDGPHLIMGSRRVKAIALLNLELDEPRKVMAVVSEPESDEVAFAQAVIENLHRKNPNAIDNALNIQKIRKEHKWEGTKGTKKVAEYLNVSPATITQHDRLLTLEPQYQQAVGKGLLTTQAALDLLDVPAKDREDVLDKAIHEKQREIQQASADTADAAVAGKGKGKGGGARKTKAVGSKHVRRAARETAEAKGESPEKPKSLGKADILDFFNDYYGANPSVYGYPDGALQTFLAYFLDKFVKGMGSVRTLDKHFMAMVEQLDKGTKASMPTEHEKSEGKTQHRATTTKKKKAA